MITVDENVVTTTVEEKKEEKKVGTKVFVYKYEIANQLLQIGYRLTEIIKDKRYPEKNYPVYVFYNEKEIFKVLDGLIAKARAERESKKSDDGQTVTNTKE